MPDDLFASINSLKKTIISWLFIPDYQSSAGMPYNQYVYAVSLAVSQHTVSHANKYNEVENGCNFHAGDVVYPCTELTTFKASNLKEGRCKNGFN